MLKILMGNLHNVQDQIRSFRRDIETIGIKEMLQIKITVIVIKVFDAFISTSIKLK